MIPIRLPSLVRRSHVIALVPAMLACDGGTRDEAPSGGRATPAKEVPVVTATSEAPAASSVAPPDSALCARIVATAVTDIFGKAPDKAFGLVEDTASGSRLRCEWQSGPIASMRVSIYPTDSFWTTVVQAGASGGFPESFAAWAEAHPDATDASLARRGVPPTGFAFRAAGGHTVDISVVGRKSVTDAQLVAMGDAVLAQL